MIPRDLFLQSKQKHHFLYSTFPLYMKDLRFNHVQNPWIQWWWFRRVRISDFSIEKWKAGHKQFCSYSCLCGHCILLGQRGHVKNKHCFCQDQINKCLGKLLAWQNCQRAGILKAWFLEVGPDWNGKVSLPHA